jgi:hypothetical protein
MKKIFIRMGILLFIIYIGTGTFLYLQQRTFLYHPTQNISSKYNTMVLINDSEKIIIIVLNDGHKIAILYFGGNAESMAVCS